MATFVLIKIGMTRMVIDRSTRFLDGRIYTHSAVYVLSIGIDTKASIEQTTPAFQ